MALGDFGGVIPREYSAQIIEEAVRASAALSLGNRMPMGTKITELPVPKTFPNAEWVTAPGGRKLYTDVGLQPQVITAEEVAAVIAIPDVYLEDAEINLWNWCRPVLAQAIGIAVDRAVLFGMTGTPATFPPGGVIAPAYSTPVTTGIDTVDAVNRAMSAVEAQGLTVGGHAADLVVRGMLRGVRDQNDALLLSEARAVGERTLPTLYGVPIAYNAFAQTPVTVDFITGAWEYLIIGVRQDIRYKMDPAGVILGTTTANSVSGFQDNVTPMKVWARFGCTIVKPVTPRVPGGATPFARARLATITPPAADAEGESRAKK